MHYYYPGVGDKKGPFPGHKNLDNLDKPGQILKTWTKPGQNPDKIKKPGQNPDKIKRLGLLSLWKFEKNGFFF